MVYSVRLPTDFLGLAITAGHSDIIWLEAITSKTWSIIISVIKISNIKLNTEEYYDQSL